MKRAFGMVAFELDGRGTVAVEIAEPFAVFEIGEVAEAPVVNVLMPLGVTGIAGQLVGQGCGDEAFAVG